MPCDKTVLFDFLSVLNEDLTKKIILVAAGGTAMTLLDLKPSTIDIDFTIPGCERVEFEPSMVAFCSFPRWQAFGDYM